MHKERKNKQTSKGKKMSTSDGVKGDVEEGLLHPGIGYTENQLRWGFIRKVYGILATQVLLTTLISAITVFYTPINNLLLGNTVLLIVLCVTPLIVLLPLYFTRQKHPWNFVFLGLFTLSLSFALGIACANTNGKVVLGALILTSAVVAALTGYTFWASKKGQDFSFLGPILLASVSVLVLGCIIQIFVPLGSIFSIIYSAISAIIFCCYIVYDTSKLIRRFKYDEYIWASVSLYLDILNLFLDILKLLRLRNN